MPTVRILALKELTGLDPAQFVENGIPTVQNDIALAGANATAESGYGSGSDSQRDLLATRERQHRDAHERNTEYSTDLCNP